MLDLEKVRQWARYNNAKVDSYSSIISSLFSLIDTSSDICKDPLFPLYLRVVLDQEELPNIYTYWTHRFRHKCYGREWSSAKNFESKEIFLLTYMLNQHNIHYDNFNKILYDTHEMFNIVGEPASNYATARYNEYFAYNYMILDNKLMLSHIAFSKTTNNSSDTSSPDVYEFLSDSRRTGVFAVSATVLTHVLEGYSQEALSSRFEKVKIASIPVYLKLLKHPVVSLDALSTIMTHNGFIPMLESGNLDIHNTIAELLAIKSELPLDVVRNKYNLSLEFNLSLPVLIASLHNVPIVPSALPEIEFSV